MEPNLILLTGAAICGAIGLALIFVGGLMALLVALGNKQYVFGVLMFLFFPVAYVFAFVEKEKMRYASNLLWGGLLLFVLFVGLLWWELEYRLGLDFIEMMKTTTPKHSMAK